MKKQKQIIIWGTLAGMLVLIFDGQTALRGMRDGIEICLQTLIPSLFPFFVLSGIATSSLAGQAIPILRPICKICNMSPGTESLFAIGILGGYPVGAANISDAYRSGHLSSEEASRYAVFCNNTGPAFIFGVLSRFFPDIRWVLVLWLIQFLAAVLTGYILVGTDSGNVPTSRSQISISNSVSNAIRNMAGVCAWVVLFRTCLEFLNRWFLRFLPPILQVALTGILELSNGCLRLDQIDDLNLRFQVASAMLSMGGICILMQTRSVFPELDVWRYIIGKLVHLMFSLLLSFAAVLLTHKMNHYGPVIVVAVLTVCMLRIRKAKKEVAIP